MMKQTILAISIFSMTLSSLTSCSSNEKNSLNTDNQWRPPVFVSGSGSTVSGEVYEEHFCDTYLSSDAFVYGEIVSIEWVQNPHLNYDPKTQQYVANDDDSRCTSIEPTLKIEIIPEQHFSAYERKISSKTIDIYINTSFALQMKPTPYPQDYVKREGDFYAKLGANEPMWSDEGSCTDNYGCVLESNQKIGLFLDYNENYDVWYMVFQVMWVPGGILPDPYDRISQTFKNIYLQTDVEKIQQQTENCTNYESTIAADRRQLEVRDLWFKKSLPVCVLK